MQSRTRLASPPARCRQRISTRRSAPLRGVAPSASLTWCWTWRSSPSSSLPISCTPLVSDRVVCLVEQRLDHEQVGGERDRGDQRQPDDRRGEAAERGAQESHGAGRTLSWAAVAKDTEKLIRQLSLISFLMAQGRPVSALEIKREVEGYSDMNDDAFARRFYADRAELESLGIAARGREAGRGVLRGGALLAAAGELLPRRDRVLRR